MERFVISRDRFFKPANITIRNPAAKAFSLAYIKGAMSVAHNRYILTQPSACSVNPLDRMSERAITGSNPHLHCLKVPALYKAMQLVGNAIYGSPTTRGVRRHPCMTCPAE